MPRHWSPWTLDLGTWACTADALCPRCHGFAICLLQTCASGIRSRVNATEFGALYLKDVPVLQWAAHATQENYRRLSRYGGCHGWGDVDYQSQYCLFHLLCKYYIVSYILCNTTIFCTFFFHFLVTQVTGMLLVVQSQNQLLLAKFVRLRSVKNLTKVIRQP